MFNIGFIGLKGHYSSISRDIPNRDDARFAALATSDKSEMAQAKGNGSSDVHFYMDYREMLAKEKLDVVTISTTDGEKSQVIQDCANAGANIISEKPLAISLEELAAAKKAVEANKVQLSMLMTLRFVGSYLAAKEIVDSGAIGEVVQMVTRRTYKLGQRPEWVKHRESFSGIIPFVGIHAIDLLRWISGREFVAVAAFQSNVAHPEIGDMEDSATVSLRLDNGGTASVSLNFLQPAAAPSHGDAPVVISGSKGVVEVAKDGSSVMLMTMDKAPETVALPPSIPLLGNFLDSLKSGHEPHVSMEDSFRITEICLKAREAAETGKILSL